MVYLNLVSGAQYLSNYLGQENAVISQTASESSLGAIEIYCDGFGFRYGSSHISMRVSNVFSNATKMMGSAKFLIPFFLLDRVLAKDQCGGTVEDPEQAFFQNGDSTIRVDYEDDRILGLGGILQAASNCGFSRISAISGVFLEIQRCICFSFNLNGRYSIVDLYGQNITEIDRQCMINEIDSFCTKKTNEQLMLAGIVVALLTACGISLTCCVGRKKNQEESDSSSGPQLSAVLLDSEVSSN